MGKWDKVPCLNIFYAHCAGHADFCGSFVNQPATQLIYSMQKRILQVVVSMQPAEFAFAYCTSAEMQYAHGGGHTYLLYITKLLIKGGHARKNHE